ncbi:MAG TPA: ATP-binding protein [Tepidisphaeraceae bacterium]|jgi:AAA+ superfamily predicted ATPase
MSIQLSPSQQRAADALESALAKEGNCLTLWCRSGLGRTTVLRELQRRTGATLLTVRELVETLSARHPLAIEESFYRVVCDALSASDRVIVDDFHLLTDIVTGCHAYPRANYLAIPLMALATRAAEAGKKLILGTEGQAPSPLHDRAVYVPSEDYAVEDYAFLCGAFLGESAASQLNYPLIHRFAPKLTAHQFEAACAALKGGSLTTDAFIEYLRSRRMASNVDLGEVQAVDLHDLQGIDDVIESLEANVIVPLENESLAEELNIRPKRGVLLVGPPGTGITTIGRALAHRLKSKFFLIDGTFISGTAQFYANVHRVFEAAKQNAPAVIFIDDSDVIFEDGQEAGLYRYLLTMLDGLESQSAGRVCVMLTAMNVGSLPPALVRSGRVELWLETRLPDDLGRLQILRKARAGLPPALSDVDVESLVTATEGMTGADLKRLMEDAKLLYAHDRARAKPARSATEYFVSAARTVRENKARYADAEAQARSRRPMRPPWFDVQSFMSFAEAQVSDGPA